MSNLRDILRPSDDWIRNQAREHRWNGLESYFEITGPEPISEHLFLPDHETSVRLLASQPDLTSLIAFDLSRHLKGPDAEAEAFSFDQGVSLVLNYFYRLDRDDEEDDLEAPFTIRVSNVLAPIYDGLMGMPIFTPKSADDAEYYAEQWRFKDDVYEVASRILVNFATNSRSSYEFLGNRFNFGAFAFATVLSAVGIIEQAGFNDRLDRMPRSGNYK